MSKQIKQANILLHEIVANKFLLFFFSGFLFPVSLGTKQTKKEGAELCFIVGDTFITRVLRVMDINPIEKK